jgi:flagellar motor protein MotB
MVGAALVAAAAGGCKSTESQAQQDAKDRQILMLTEEKHRLEQQLAQEQSKNAALASQQPRYDRAETAAPAPKTAPRAAAKAPELPAGLREKGVQMATVDGRPALRIPGTILFAPGQATLGPSAQGLLKQVAEQIRRSPGSIRVAGHTDSDPILKSKHHFKSNQELSEARAKAVRDALVAGGIERARLEVVGHGDAKPIASNKTADGKRQNRRVELVLLGD